LLRERAGVPATHTLQMTRFPIDDYSIADDRDVAALALHVAEVVRNTTSVVVVHCVGGHGRTGTLVPCVLTRLYRGMSCEDALDITGASHQCRDNTRVCTHSSPENKLQRDQVLRICPQLETLAAKSSFKFKSVEMV
jgi:protein tyrosine phosphatase